MASSARSSPIIDRRDKQRERSSSDPPIFQENNSLSSGGDAKKDNDMKGAIAKVQGPSTPPVERKSKFPSISRLFKPWKWKRKKKTTSEKFHQTQITIERKISMRATKEELIEKGVLNPDAYEEANNIPPGSVRAASSANKDKPKVTTANSITPESSTTTTTTTVHIDTPPPLPQKKGSDKSSESAPVKPPLVTTTRAVVVPSEAGDASQTAHHTEHPPGVAASAVPSESTSQDIPATDSSEQGSMGNAASEDGKVDISEMNKENEAPNSSNINKVSVSGGVSIFSPVVIGKSQVVNGDIHRFDSDSDDEPILYRDDDTDSEEESGLAAKVKRKDSLAIKLQNRPSMKELVNRNILPDRSESEKQENKKALGVKLERRLSLRPTQEELEQRNIMRKMSQKERYEDMEKTKSILTRKLSFRPTVEELKRRNILKFCDYVEVTQAIDYDRKADKPWTRLTPQDKAAIRKELNDYKSAEMEVHEDSRQYTRFHRP
ncbi:phosphatase and actin regulator 1-like isoform X2 [Ptychodera flava]|uniref:phosphatase and actin regulator 1-like isoform X2 n=1 Tax=Ptychodera flava TaxID=63121 RepID=UPI00396A7079